MADQSTLISDLEESIEELRKGFTGLEAETPTLNNDPKFLQEQLHLSEQERREWKGKYELQKEINLGLLNENSQKTRTVYDLRKHLEKTRLEQSALYVKFNYAEKKNRDERSRCAEQISQLVSRSKRKTEAIENITAMLTEARARLRELESEEETIHTTIVSNLDDFTREKITEAQRLQQAAEAEVRALGHIEDANKLLQEELEVSQRDLIDSKREELKYKATIQKLQRSLEDANRAESEYKARILELSQTIETRRGAAKTAQERIEQLEQNVVDVEDELQRLRARLGSNQRDVSDGNE